MTRAAAVFALGAALMLGACGFRPLYGKAAMPDGALETFARIEIAPVEATNDSDEIGMLVADALDAALHGAGQSGATAYRLELKLSDERRGLAIQDDTSITRYNYRLSAKWRLTETGKDTPMAEGNASATASYNVVDSQYATLIARNDAERRAALEIAEQIKLRLALALQTKP